VVCQEEVAEAPAKPEPPGERAVCRSRRLSPPSILSVQPATAFLDRIVVQPNRASNIYGVNQAPLDLHVAGAIGRSQLLEPALVDLGKLLHLGPDVGGAYLD
jgi:hypothetical protein